jgi:hypothetical protein
VQESNLYLEMIERGATHKRDILNIGYPIHTLISDTGLSMRMMQNIIRETISRNAVYLLQNHPDFAYMEPTPFSDYRLAKTFEASKTSCRILMFLNFFRRVAVGTPRRSVQKLRDSAFARYGAPPPSGVKELAESIKMIHKVDSSNDFLATMGLARTTKE